MFTRADPESNSLGDGTHEIEDNLVSTLKTSAGNLLWKFSSMDLLVPHRGFVRILHHVLNNINFIWWSSVAKMQ